LKQDGLWEDTLLVVVADHGEEFNAEAPGHGHGTLSEDATHVPLLVHLPGQREGRRIDAAASLLDVTPTILSQVYEEVPAGFAGVPLLGQALPDDRAVFSFGVVADRGMHRPPVTFAAYRAGFKYWLDRKSGQERLFDLRHDRRGVRDVAGQHPQRLAALRAQARPILDTLE
jgi:arylsulfatase A-like enzyme